MKRILREGEKVEKMQRLCVRDFGPIQSCDNEIDRHDRAAGERQEHLGEVDLLPAVYSF